MWEKFNHYMNCAYEMVAMVLLAGIIIASSLQVFTRYVLNASMTGTEECARYCFVWLSMLGASICVRKCSHAAVTIVNDMLKGNLKRYHTILIQIFILVGAIIMIVQGGKMVPMSMTQKSPTLGIPMGLIYLSVPVGAIGIFFNALYNIWESLRKDGAE